MCLPENSPAAAAQPVQLRQAKKINKILKKCAAHSHLLKTPPQTEGRASNAKTKQFPPRFQKISLKEFILIKKIGKLAVQSAKHTCHLGKTAPTNASRQISAKPESGAKENAFKDFDKKTQTG